MTALAWAALIGGLACVPIADPTTRRWVRARLRLRRIRRSPDRQDRQAVLTLHRELLNELAGVSKQRTWHASNGFHYRAKEYAQAQKRVMADLVKLEEENPWLV